MDGLICRNGVWYVDAHWGRGRRVRKSLRTTDLAVARIIAAPLFEKLTQTRGEDWREFGAASEAELLVYLVRSRERAMRRDRLRKREPNLSPDDMRTMFVRCGGRCEVTRIPFSLAKAMGTFRRPFAPSIDRLDNALPYSLENCRLICLAANIGINEWGESVFRRIAIGFLSKPGTKSGTDVSRETS